jgi:hypothetical protein
MRRPFSVFLVFLPLMILFSLLANSFKVLLEFLNMRLHHLLMGFQEGASLGYGGVPLPSQGGELLHVTNGHAGCPQSCQKLDPGQILYTESTYHEAEA